MNSEYGSRDSNSKYRSGYDESVGNNSNVNDGEITFNIGDKVKHKKYGYGIIKERNFDNGDIIIEIDFNNAGLKRFIESMVMLQKI